MKDTTLAKEREKMSVAVVDIGGTSIKSGLFDDGKLICLREVPSEAEQGAQCLMKQVTALIERFSGMFDRIGISTAGQVDSVNGVIRYANENIPGYTGFDVRELFENRFSVPVVVENDVNAAAIGEAKFGAGKASMDKNFLCLTYGTGIGGAIVSKGEIYHGSSYSAGEFGAIITHGEDRDSKKDSWSGCYEKYASTNALTKRVGKIYPHLNDGKKIFANLENPVVKKEIDLWIDEVVIGLTSLIYIFNPSIIVVGGGIMKEEYINEQLKKKLYDSIMPSFNNVKICKAILQNQAGLYGAGWLSIHRL